MKKINPNTYLTARELAVRLRVTDARIRQMIAEGKIPTAVKRGGVWFIPASYTPPEAPPQATE